MRISPASIYDVLVVGGGPSGATCAALCAAGGRRVVLLERAHFPREKVCGDCLNPGAWPVLHRLDVADQVRAHASSPLRRVDFADVNGISLSCLLSDRGAEGERVIKRSLLDQILLTRARECGAEIIEEATVTRVSRKVGEDWEVHTGETSYRCKMLIAADGRNSTVARLLGLLPAATPDRVGLQTHLPTPPECHDAAVMRFLPTGYCGLADLGNGEANLCLVAHPRQIDEVKRWATAHFSLPPELKWRSISPIERDSSPMNHPGLMLVGDAARVVEPFTGEGILYALKSGELAAQCLLENQVADYPRRHRQLYRGRMWINQLARAACKYPWFASSVLWMARFFPSALRFLTQKVIAEPYHDPTVPTSRRAAA